MSKGARQPGFEGSHGRRQWICFFMIYRQILSKPFHLNVNCRFLGKRKTYCKWNLLSAQTFQLLDCTRSSSLLIFVLVWIDKLAELGERERTKYEMKMNLTDGRMDLRQRMLTMRSIYFGSVKTRKNLVACSAAMRYINWVLVNFLLLLPISLATGFVLCFACLWEDF